MITASDHLPQAIALDVGSGKMYWTSPKPTLITPGSIRRANLDGTDEEAMVSGAGSPRALAVAGGKIYWTNTYEIRRANLDGSNVETVVDLGSGGNSLLGITLDVTSDN